MGYNPNIREMDDLSCEIYINGIRHEEIVLDDEFEYVVKTEKNQEVEIKFVTKGAIQAPQSDLRKLAFVLSNIIVE